MRTVAIVQARMGSSRLPGKVLRPLAGVPMVYRVIERLRRAETLDEVVIATSTDPGDDALVGALAPTGVRTVRGSEDDVLSRYHLAATESGATTVVRVTSDCPLICPEVVDQVVRHLHSDSTLDYVSNTIERTYPRGLDAEAFTFEALDRTHRTATEAPEREHVTAHMYRHPEGFRLGNVRDAADNSHLRLTVDTPEDYELAERIFVELAAREPFGYAEILATMAAHPDWASINAHVEQKAYGR